MGRSEVKKRRSNLPKAHLYVPFWVYWEPIKSSVAEPNKVPYSDERSHQSLCPMDVVRGRRRRASAARTLACAWP
ncbi:MAG: hypothetical protein M3Y74_10645, partial [Chloroflexota bacterium]|nr:hypothetical protein [Chloroflexota bacterium]